MSDNTVIKDQMGNDDCSTNEPNINRRDFIVLTASAMAAVGTGAVLWPIIDSMNPSAEVLALGSVEIDLTPIKAGQSITAMWRGKPVFIRHRTEAEIKDANSVSLNDLKDPEVDSARVKKGYEQWLVMVGICTHLGCVPLSQTDGNWFCPCHGSHYDTSGRIRKGPAPSNLAIPEYVFLTDTKIKIG